MSDVSELRDRMTGLAAQLESDADTGEYRGGSYASSVLKDVARRIRLTLKTEQGQPEVLEADDTVPVERLAHWLHGEFDSSAENSELLRWAQEREDVKARYRHTARALMSQLPELFR